MKCPLECLLLGVFSRVSVKNCVFQFLMDFIVKLHASAVNFTRPCAQRCVLCPRPLDLGGDILRKDIMNSTCLLYDRLSS